MNISVLDLFNGVIFFAFAIWPLYLLAPLKWRKNKLTGLVIIWSVLAVVRALLIFNPTPVIGILVPEPLNTVIFVVTGVVLILLKVSRDGLQRHNIQKKADNARGVEDLQDLSPKEFEDMVVELYTAMGHKAKRTGATGDHGVDVVVQANNGEKWVVQCKRWRGTVGEPVVRDFHGVMQHEKADKGAVITTGKFTLQAKEWAKGKPITLVEGDEFLTHIKQAHGLPEQTSITSEQNSYYEGTITPPYCPKCGSKMILRIAKQGVNQGEKFWGCSTFPQCRGIVKYNA